MLRKTKVSAREARRFFQVQKLENPYENQRFRRAKRAGFLGVLGTLLETNTSQIEKSWHEFIPEVAERLL